MTKRSTTEEFITKARAVHGDKYGYSKTIYKNNHTKIIIVCPKHGDFEQTPNDHLNGRGCAECANKTRREKQRHITEDFVKQAKKIHGDKYDYSLVKYKSSKRKVIIICPEHGPFEQAANNHLMGQGCRKCGKDKVADTKRKNIEEFITKARAVHGDKYDYSKIEYKNSYTKVVIICPIHGEFEQAPGCHLRDHGCPLCGHNMYTTESFIAKAKQVHGDKYDYSLVDYKGSFTKVKIICPEHGVFEKRPDGHINQKYGCPACSGRGQSDHVYLLVDSEYKPTRMKIGITCDLEKRLRQLKARNKHAGLQPTPFKIFKRACYKVGPGKAYEIEQMFHRYYASRNLGYTGFDGATEWFEYDPQAEKLLAEIAANKMKTSA